MHGVRGCKTGGMRSSSRIRDSQATAPIEPPYELRLSGQIYESGQRFSFVVLFTAINW